MSAKILLTFGLNLIILILLNLMRALKTLAVKLPTK